MENSLKMNKQQQKTFDFFVNNSDRNMFLSGAAGTGDEKTFSSLENLKPTLKVEYSELKEEPLEVERKGTELTFSEMEAISDLARGSSVGREKAEFAALKASLIEEENEKSEKKNARGSQYDHGHWC